MNLGLRLSWPFRRSATVTSQPVRYVVATKRESRKAARRAADVQIELAVYNATTTAEQRKAETDAFFAARAGRKARAG